jgi:hypothetical protein
MRLVLTVVLLLLVLGLVSFLLYNLETRVPVTLGSRSYPDVHLFWVVFVSVAVGALATFIIALVEGATVRLANRRLRREIRRLETEINFLRTQPPTTARLEPDALDVELSPMAPVHETDRDLDVLPSAPVYDGSEMEESWDPDEDAYSGGRAV